jgi:hypothetical protein
LKLSGPVVISQNAEAITIPPSQANPAAGRIPDPWDWPKFRASIEQARARALLTAPARAPAAWIDLGYADLIVYPAEADWPRQLREIAHQAAHLLLAHHPIATSDALDLFPHLDPAAIEAAIKVSHYSEADEEAAANFASQAVAAMTSQPGMDTFGDQPKGSKPDDRYE